MLETICLTIGLQNKSIMIQVNMPAQENASQTLEEEETLWVVPWNGVTLDSTVIIWYLEPYKA